MMPFVHQAWYVAALSGEVTDKPLARTLLDIPMVLFRQSSGAVNALLDMCTHRFAPLSAGVLRNDNLQCPYHGLEFDGSGRCVRNPHGNHATPIALNVRAFKIVEQFGLIWIWPGDNDSADANTIPNISSRAEANRRTQDGYSHIECNYRLLIDNLMDPGHAQYVHKQSAESDAFDRLETQVVVQNGEIHGLRKYPDGKPTPVAAWFMETVPERIDTWVENRWMPVSVILNFIGVGAAGSLKENSANMYNMHAITPETETSCHYFYGHSRNFALQSPKMDAALRSWQAQALDMEDRQIVEAVQRRLAFAQRVGLRPALLACDEAAARVARVIDRLESANIAAPLEETTA